MPAGARRRRGTPAADADTRPAAEPDLPAARLHLSAPLPLRAGRLLTPPSRPRRHFAGPPVALLLLGGGPRRNCRTSGAGRGRRFSERRGAIAGQIGRAHV